jgi:hypothetical protein
MHASARIARLFSPSLAAAGLVVACNGDDSSSGGSMSATAGFTSTTEASGTSTEASTSAGSESEGTSTSTSTMGASESQGSTATDSESGTDSGTTAGGGFCGDDPPPGFVGDFDPECKNEAKVGTFNPVVEWKRASWTVNPGSRNVMMMPIVASLNDDDKDGEIDDADVPDIILVTADAGQDGPGTVRALSGDGSIEHWDLIGQLCATSGLAAGDIDGDGLVEIVGITADLRIRAFEHDGALKWTSAETFLSDLSFCYSTPAIADMDADGKPEVIVGRVIMNSDGTLRAKGAFGTGAASFSSVSFAADVDGDGVQEVVVGNALYRPDGTAKWNNGLTDGYPAIADFDGDDAPEIVIAGGGIVRLQNAGGGTIWSVTNPGQAGGPPTIADFDGDGAPEIGVAGRTAYVVFDGDGAVLWQQPTIDFSSSATGSSVYDFEGDGIADVVYADEEFLYVFAGNDGTIKLKYAEHNNATIIEYPLILDVDGDGEVEIVVVHWNYMGAETGVTVLGDMDQSWRPGRKIWNQHAYSITNVTDSGGIPAKPAPNWPKYNSFRSGDLSANVGTAAPDLKVIAPESCENECGGVDVANIWVQVGNAGAAPLTAGAVIQVFVTVKGVESLDQELPFDTILAPGEYADAVMIQVTTTDVEAIRIAVKPKESECTIDPADELVLVPPFCIAPG